MKRAFTGPDKADRYERAGHWLLATVYGRSVSRDWCDRKGVQIRKATGEGIGSAGGFLVPTELENAILDLRDSFGAFRRRACVWPMGSDTSLFPRRTGSSTAAFIGEGAAAGASTTNLDGVQLTAKKLGALVTLSSELAEDAIVDMVDYVANEMAWALASKEDDCGFYGDGTATYGGMRGITTIALDGVHGLAKVVAATGHNTYGLLDSTDLGNLVAGVRASALERAAWFVSVSGFALTLARAETGGYLETRLEDGISTPFYNGFPVVFSQKFPLVNTSVTGKAMMAFGDLYAGAVLGQRRGLTIARSDHRYLDTDQIAILATERFAAVVHDMGDNNVAGSIAVLVAP
ncbi:MAG TPA: phage major capsid protein [Caulobacteraceae bacterium]|jgi:HK97 family phage major capsid protein